MSRVLTSFLHNGQSSGIRSGINQKIFPSQYLLYSPWRPSILEFCTGEWRPGPPKVCPRTAYRPLEQQSTRPNEGSAAVYCWWIQQQPIYIHLSGNMQVEANIMVMFICFWLQNVCKCICKLSAPIRLMAKCHVLSTTKFGVAHRQIQWLQVRLGSPFRCSQNWAAPKGQVEDKF